MGVGLFGDGRGDHHRWHDGGQDLGDGRPGRRVLVQAGTDQRQQRGRIAAAMAGND
jgi:hypothetical protein